MSRVLPLHDAADAVVLTRPFDHPDATELRHSYAEERRDIVGFDDPPGLDPPEQYLPPTGLFLVAYTVSGAAIACGGFRPYPHRTNVVEIRKMFVAPTCRRLGVGARMLEELEYRAIASGATEVILETGSYNAAALRLYAAAGYVRIRPYVPNRPSFNRAYTKALAHREPYS